MTNLYLERYAWPEAILDNYEAFDHVEYIVVIPCFNESDIHKALESLNSCLPPEGEVLVVVVVNEPENASATITRTNESSLHQVQELDPWFHLHAVHLKLPAKKAGVGLARKIGMDEAIRIFDTSGKDGIIICYDADCSCDPNYFQAIASYYHEPEHLSGLIYYEHPLDGDNSTQILQYELFLRYYITSLRYAGFPHALQTLGSCITVRSSAYQKQGGMNTRKAGEDFYFIHKILLLGGIGEITDTCVLPSDRVSDRVPFGTGHAIGNLLTDMNQDYPVYAPPIFDYLKTVFGDFEKLYSHQLPLQDLDLPDSIQEFYLEHDFESALKNIRKQSNTLENFRKRFFAWWDAFRVLKFVHFSRDRFYPNVPLQDGLNWLRRAYFLEEGNLPDSLPTILKKMRLHDRQHPVYIR